MFVRSILLGGAAALGASAMLVVPEMEPQVEAVEDGFLNVHPMLLEDIRNVVVALPCKECPFREDNEEGAVSWTEGKPSTLMLDFSIEENRLLANGRQIFPPVPPSPVLAIQELEDGEAAGPMPVGYALEVMPLGSPDDTPGTELLDVRFTILDLESHPVPVDTVAITLIQDPTGELYIAKTEIEKTTPPAERLSWKKCNGKPKCLQQLLVARVRGLLAAAKNRVLGMAGKGGRKGGHKGCGKNKGMLGMAGHHGPPKHHDEFVPEGITPFSGFEGPEGLDDKEHHRHHHHPEGGDFGAEMGDRPPPPPHGHHGHHGHHPPPPHGAFAHTFSRVVRFIVVPAILGVLAGLTASAVGMLVGQAIIFLWQRYRGTKPQEHKAAWEQGDACEKQGLMAETSETSESSEASEASEDTLPAYESSSRRDSVDKP
ncbi:uncharacterized protein N7482_002964 [Penicillium canariense]|uniref:DUF7728 domain-containing protein n=1 Tax=Penicillium canariense TaxID=189055 RepID=A0A9W9IIR1_9EURO|nr:uncharacterized protein N7482_002964 [Penicillium canariense]KAJ5177087.1 hypothetical protein N7482_002964 [Penicillium canariense]